MNVNGSSWNHQCLRESCSEMGPMVIWILHEIIFKWIKISSLYQLYCLIIFSLFSSLKHQVCACSNNGTRRKMHWSDVYMQTVAGLQAGRWQVFLCVCHCFRPTAVATTGPDGFDLQLESLWRLWLWMAFSVKLKHFGIFEHCQWQAMAHLRVSFYIWPKDAFSQRLNKSEKENKIKCTKI